MLLMVFIVYLWLCFILLKLCSCIVHATLKRSKKVWKPLKTGTFLTSSPKFASLLFIMPKIKIFFKFGTFLITDTLIYTSLLIAKILILQESCRPLAQIHYTSFGRLKTLGYRTFPT